ncbi:transglycosylase [Azorhizobium oxalatiphilum]|uniref:Transglycosylase n=1 Tax=Azorhizobium oxalatiphilum TaxID=980631 RepID=A0A917C728_9HYPH|nr:lytic transglycosylase domain-containing protein [Azorhizobium oxalatiphilum]GGF73649.1 transglycosylase [Azorhizobium oxalatiphilum]
MPHHDGGRAGRRGIILILVAACVLSAAPAKAQRAGEAMDDALCRLIEDAAKANALPVPFFTRLIWQESSFRLWVVSSKGAQGIAQFMPGTAAERGLADPFDPEAALPASAHLLADHARAFGNLGLAAAAYNAGPGRVQAFLAGRSGLPSETRAYVLAITGRSAEDWKQAGRDTKAGDAVPAEGCRTVVAALRRGAGTSGVVANAEFSPWGIQVAGAVSKSAALAAYQRQAKAISAVFADTQPMIIGTRLAGRGRAPFYRVRMPAQTRQEANAACTRLKAAGASCIVLAN